ncbi:Phosphodiesterase/alkaline phosphatase D [Blastococcus aggregatus]|uniref:Phosphodiesterase/alkaline phosphatase D n=1 Tax=Blastococcus aggregatus TaxID=38502 RepID=A0A285V6M8_9ACTN|nr:alkaline phosphatase D family protein [Blastococcus aggregatus]SOC49587.1 Phosphodiesterase/alkaline phosphatase D [Blastococcus aggregatus]
MTRTGSRRRVKEDWWADADIDRAQIFVPAIMGAGLLISAFTLVRDAFHGRHRRGRDRRTVLQARASAAFVRTGTPPDAALLSGLRPRLHYLFLGLSAGGLAVYGARGATKNYAPDEGMFAGLAWMYALLLALVAALAVVSALSLLTAATWPDLPRWARPLLAVTPLGQAPVEGQRRGSLLVGWAALLTAAAAVQFVFTTAGAPQLLAELDDEITDPVASVVPWELLGGVPLAVGLAVVVGVVGRRCPTFALGQLGVVVGALIAHALFADRLERAFPPDGPMAGLTGSLPSAPALQATLFAGFLPLAVYVATRRRTAALVALGLTSAGVLAASFEIVRSRLSWPSDVVAGVLLGLALVLGTWWALEHRPWHRRCAACPWELPGDVRAGPGLLQVPAARERTVRRGARLWLAGAVVLFAALALVEGLPASPEGVAMGPALSRQLQLALLGLAAVALLVALRWEAVGAALAALAGTGLAVFASITYQPWVSLLIAGLFLVPAVGFWLVWQHRRTMRAVVTLAMATALLLAGTFGASAEIYDRLFGPLHPRSATLPLAVDAVAWTWSGAVTARSAEVVAKIDGDADEVRLAVTGGDGTVRSDVVPPGPDDVVRLDVDGLEPGTDYRYAVEVDGEPDRSRGAGTFSTPPEGPASFTIAVASCARTGSSGAVFDAIRAVDPALFIHMGDLHYANIARDEPTLFGDRYEDALTSPAQAALYRAVPVSYVWSDHDYGPENADSSSPSRDAARAAYRTYVPHHELVEGDGGAIYHAFTMGRVRVVMTDTRSEKTDTTMLGERQLVWLQDELVTASRDHALVLWVNPDPWVAPDEPGRDDWGGYADERRRIADTLADAGVENLVMVSGDAHMVAADDGTNTDYSTGGRGGFPLLHAAAMDSPGTLKGGPYSEGAFPGAGQFGTVTVTDTGGDAVDVELTGRNWRNEVLVSYRTRLPVPSS